jgi:hypothetical protein
VTVMTEAKTPPPPLLLREERREATAAVVMRVQVRGGGREEEEEIGMTGGDISTPARHLGHLRQTIGGEES